MSKNIILNNENILERLHTALDNLGLKRHGRGVVLTKATGYSSGQLSGLLNGKVELNDRFIKTICTKYLINEKYLTTGEGEMFTSSGIGVGGGAIHVPATGVAEQKKPPEILFAEGLLPQLTPDDLNEVIGDMLGRIKKEKNRANNPLFDLLPDNKPLAIAALKEQLRMLEDPEGELSQTPVAKPATER